MPQYRVSLWNQKPGSGSLPGHIPATDVEAGSEIEAAALALDDFRRLGREFSLTSALEPKLLEDDDEQPDSPEGYPRLAVEDVVAWANRAGRELVRNHGLDWLLEFSRQS